MRGWWRDLTDLVLPAECGGCGRVRTVLCPECRRALSGAVPRRVRPVPEPPGLPVVHAAARYGDEVRAVLLAHKERGVLALAGPLGVALAGAVRVGLEEAWTGAGGAGFAGARGPVLLVPVPSARRAVRARGHDPARRIALAAAGELRRSGTPARVLAVLRQRRAVADQSGLGARRRLDNLAGALAVAPGADRLLGGGQVVLVDDLMTTGASLTEAARAVRAARTEAIVDRGERAESSAVRGTYGSVRTAVYPSVVWEGREEQKSGEAADAAVREPEAPGMAGPGGGGAVVREDAREVICAAVVAASPDPFQINRN
ncbi:ComF family protein [Streptomyces sp. NPDC052309]|uniref:ComF family protein n=1 Tax=Streptomyces sp. NPDC052309 TaxID=3155421 RepID=UPI003428F148